MFKKRGELTDKQKADRDDRRAEKALHQAMVASTVKGFAVLNGAGVVAMLGFMQALAGKAQMAAFKPFGIVALGFFLAGSFACAVVYMPLSNYLNFKVGKRKNKLDFVNFLTSAMMAAVAGAVACTLGIIRAL